MPRPVAIVSIARISLIRSTSFTVAGYRIVLAGPRGCGDIGEEWQRSRRPAAAARLTRTIWTRHLCAAAVTHARHMPNRGVSGENVPARPRNAGVSRGNTRVTPKRRCLEGETHPRTGNAGVLSDARHTCVRPRHSVAQQKQRCVAPTTQCPRGSDTHAAHPRRTRVARGIHAVSPGRGGVGEEHLRVTPRAQACHGRPTCASRRETGVPAMHTWRRVRANAATAQRISNAAPRRQSATGTRGRVSRRRPCALVSVP